MSKAASVAALVGRRVLIVEDELLTAMEMERLLSELGCEVMGPAPSLTSAIALLDQDRPDLAVLDIQLGTERVTPVAERLEARGIPFVLVTGYGHLELKEPALQGAPRLSKPVEESEIIRALARLLPDRGRAA